jgi:hypothetical protein
LAGLAVYALGIGSAKAAFVAFMFAALPIMLTLSILTATAGAQLVERLRSEITEIKRWGGYVLLLVGTGLIALGLWAQAVAKIFPV